MDIKATSAFVTVMAEGSITQAASILGLSQPAVSIQMARLEAELGFALFTRTGNRVRPTAEAQAFHQEAVRTLGVIEGLERMARTIRSGHSGDLVIAAHPSAAISLLPPTLADFKSQRPDVRIELLTRNSDEVRALFPSRKYDLGIAELPIDPSGLSVDRYAMDCVAIVPEQHPLASHETLTPELFHGENFVIVSSRRSIFHHIGNAFAERGATLNITAEVEMFASICAMVACGSGVSIVDPASAGMFNKLGFVCRRFEPRITYDIALFRSADYEPSVVAQAFMDVMKGRLANFCGPRPNG